METTLPQPKLLLSRFVTAGGVDYVVELACYTSEPMATWLRVQREPEPPGTIWPLVFSEHVPEEDGQTLLDQLRYGLKEPQRRMRQCLSNWQWFHKSAAAEPPGNVKGSKRSYYTRHANDCLKSALTYAPQWKLAKQLWKEITRL